MTKNKNLKQLLEEKKILVAPGAHDALTARVIEKCGFEAVYMTGYGQAASSLGMPDIGLLTMTEMLDRARKMVSAVNIPVIADADTGFGNSLNVIRTVKEYEAAGVAAIQLEDQVAPKKCGHMTGRKVISLEEMVGKIQAAKSARTSEDFLIIARTDARTNHGIEEAIKRGLAYEAAGADIIFIESVESIEEMELVNKKITKAYTLANMVEGGRTPLLKNDELETVGYDLVIYPTASTYVTSKAMFDLMKILKEEHTTSTYTENMITFSEFNSLLGLEEFRELEKKYVKE